jgi:hypothetical protein
MVYVYFETYLPGQGRITGVAFSSDTAGAAVNGNKITDKSDSLSSFYIIDEYYFFDCLLAEFMCDIDFMFASTTDGDHHPLCFLSLSPYHTLAKVLET